MVATLAGVAGKVDAAVATSCLISLRLANAEKTYPLVLETLAANLGLALGEDDIANHMQIAAWTQRAFYPQVRSNVGAWAEVTAAMAQLAHAAVEWPPLALGVAMALYSYFWWEGPESNAVNVPAGLEASSQFYRSIVYSRCDSKEMPMEEFIGRQCHLRWRHLLMVSAEIGRYIAINDRDVTQAASAMREAARFMQLARAMPYFGQLEEAAGLRGVSQPHDTSFNQDYFPGLQRGPIWNAADVPLASFLEAHFKEFLADLQSMVSTEGGEDSFLGLHSRNSNAGSHYREFGPRAEDWQTVYLVRGGHWNTDACLAAPRSCQLLKSRREIADCTHGNSGAGFLRLAPQGRLKPHFGNAPRLSAHLGLMVPAAGEIVMTVGGRRVSWKAGQAIIFDDTFIHSAFHNGVEPRFVLNVWFCHPCNNRSDTTHASHLDGCERDVRAS